MRHLSFTALRAQVPVSFPVWKCNRTPSSLQRRISAFWTRYCDCLSLMPVLFLHLWFPRFFCTFQVGNLLTTTQALWDQRDVFQNRRRTIWFLCSKTDLTSFLGLLPTRRDWVRVLRRPATQFDQKWGVSFRVEPVSLEKEITLRADQLLASSSKTQIDCFA